MIRVKINDREIQTNDKISILKAALDHQIYIPHLCHHNDLPDIGACKLCFVKIKDRNEIVQACMTNLEDGMEIITEDEEIRKLRQISMELLLAAHPEDCSTCVKYGNCELQTLIQYIGVSRGNMRGRTKGFAADKKNPLLIHEMDRCVLCGRCVRVCQDLRGVGILQYNKANEEVYIGPKEGMNLAEAGCRFCTACAEVCPTGAIRDIIIPEKNQREEVLVPCRNTCPAGTDIPEYIRKVRVGKMEDALAVIREKVTFPESLGRICTHVCEQKCRRGQVNEQISIKNIKRFAAEYSGKQEWKEKRKQLPDTGKKVCVVGGGPSGLTAAYYLRKQGHQVIVLEAEEKAGGMMQYAIPEYRLPKKVVDKEIAILLETGVELQTGCKVDHPENLAQDYDAVLLAIGTHNGVVLPMEGNDLEGIHRNIQYLNQMAKGEETGCGKAIIVLGGGNVAFDCARSARRAGAESVHIACLEERKQMTADDEEIRLAEEEGIQIHPAVTFERIIGQSHVEGVEFCEIESFTFDENRRPVIKKKENSTFRIKANTVIFAVGQRCGLSENSNIERGRASSIAVREDGITTPQDKIFACGDAVYGTKSVIQAIADGRKAASVIDQYLGGNGDISEKLTEKEPYIPYIGPVEEFAKQRRIKSHVKNVEQRMADFGEEEQGFTEEEARKEASRCLQCDLRLCIGRPVLWNDCIEQEKE